MILTIVIVIFIIIGLYLIYKKLQKRKCQTQKIVMYRTNVLQELKDIMKKTKTLTVPVIFEPVDVIYYDHHKTIIQTDIREDNDEPHETIIQTDIEEHNDPPPTFQPIMNDIVPLIIQDIPIDTQNVHDTYFGEQCSKLFDKISKEDHIFNITKIFEDTHLNKKALLILDQIKGRNGTLTRFNNRSEYAIFEEVIKQIEREDDKDKKENMIAEINHQLEDCLNENGVLVCPTGTSSRILMTLSINQLDNYPKTQTLFKQEIINQVGQWVRSTEDSDVKLTKKEILDRLVQQYGESEKDRIETLTVDWIDSIIDD